MMTDLELAICLWANDPDAVKKLMANESDEPDDTVPENLENPDNYRGPDGVLGNDFFGPASQGW